MKTLIAAILAIILVLSLSACEVEIRNPEENSSETSSGSSSESKDVSPKDMTPEELADHVGYMTFETITELGYYPVWMQPHTYIIYDENCVPTITDGGELTPEDLVGRDDIISIGFPHSNKIEPNTKAEYDLYGFIQNIYYLWPDGSYNLSPYSKTENAKITYYADLRAFEKDEGISVDMDEYQCHAIYWLANGMIAGAKETSEPIVFPRYKITFTYVGTEHCIYIGANNVFSSTLLESGNYICVSDQYNFRTAENLFNESE